MQEILRVKSITQAQEMFGLEKPKHPLVMVYNHDNLKYPEEFAGKQVAIDLYQVTYKMCSVGSFGYGRNNYDFEEGTMIFTKPGQVLSFQDWNQIKGDSTGGWSLFFHPDLIRKSELGKHIDNYSFFSYDVHEALHLSDNEKKTIKDLVDKIQVEYSMNIDKHTQKLIVANIELLLDYCTRYYDRQFYTRENLNKDMVSKFEGLLKEYYDSGKALELGVPSVKYCGTELNMSSNYLSDLLKKETGRNAQEHIHYYVVDKAKTILLSSTETVSQIAYELGFEYPQHFSKVFKKKTGMSPAEYRGVN
jgi:AraC-like DNA-binding protein